MKPTEVYSSNENGTQARKPGSARNVLINCGQVVVVKFDPVSVNFAVSNGCGIVIGEVFCATFSVLVGSEFVEVGESEVSVALTPVGRGVTIMVLFSELPVVAYTVVASPEEKSLSAEARAIVDKRRATRNNIRGL